MGALCISRIRFNQATCANYASAKHYCSLRVRASIHKNACTTLGFVELLVLATSIWTFVGTWQADSIFSEVFKVIALFFFYNILAIMSGVIPVVLIVFYIWYLYRLKRGAN